jgi:succinoglycan biosynthesis transport protein ExoP
MAEIPEEQASEGLDLQRYLSIAKRRHLQFLIPAFLGWLVVWGSSWFLPVRYKSGTLILVEQPMMPKNYVVPNVNDDVQDRLQSIKQQVLSRTRLLTIIDKFHLYQEKRRRLTPDDKVALMSKDIDIELVQDARTDQITAFKISYSSRVAYIAQQVASELTGLFISENQKVLQQESEDTTKFLEGQLESARARLADQEAKVRAFESAHEGQLPSQQASNLQILSGFQSQLQNEQDALNNAKQQREYFQTEIDQYHTLHASTRSVDGTPTGLAAIDLQLEQLRAKLADLTSHYTDQYPDVIATKDQIAKTEKRRAAFAADLTSKASTKTADAGEVEDPTASAALLQLQGQLHANQLEIANREKATSDLKEKINDYQARLNAEPASEQQLTDLTRGYEQSKTDYDELVKKKNDSEMATSMERMQQGERFTVLDPASLPLRPDFPNRLKFCGMGLGVGIALGLLVVVGLEFLDKRIHSEKELKALLPTAILSEIPDVLSPADERKVKEKLVLGWAMAAFFLATVLAGSAFSYLHN